MISLSSSFVTTLAYPLRSSHKVNFSHLAHSRFTSTFCPIVHSLPSRFTPAPATFRQIPNFQNSSNFQHFRSTATMASADYQPKVLCVFSDGTWNDLEMKTPSNIFQLSSKIAKRTSGGRAVVSYYDAGIGTSGGFLYGLRGGAFGEGIDLNIKQMYTFLAMNYEPGDEICMFGYSRGAYTVRSLVGMISEMGLLRREEINLVDEAYEVYRTKDKTAERVIDFNQASPQQVKIKLLACFDTVGALGIPSSSPALLRAIFNPSRYEFHNTVLSEIVENAIHACSIDEDRRGFVVTDMIPNEKVGVHQVTEKYLAGHHGGIGGGNEDEVDCSIIALHFMIGEIRNRGIDLVFKDDLLPDLNKAMDNAKVGSPPFFSGYTFLRAVSGQQPRAIKSENMIHDFVPVLFARDENWRPQPLVKWTEKLQSMIKQ